MSTASYQRVAQWLVLAAEPGPGKPFRREWLPHDHLDAGLDQPIREIEQSYAQATSLTPELAKRLHTDYENHRTSALFGADELCRTVRRFAVQCISDGGTSRESRVAACQNLLAVYWQGHSVASYARRCLDAYREIRDTETTKATTPHIRLPHDLYLKGDRDLRDVMEAALYGLRDGPATARSEDSPERASEALLASTGRGGSPDISQLFSTGAQYGSPRPAESGGLLLGQSGELDASMMVMGESRVRTLDGSQPPPGQGFSSARPNQLSISVAQLNSPAGAGLCTTPAAPTPIREITQD